MKTFLRHFLAPTIAIVMAAPAGTASAQGPDPSSGLEAVLARSDPGVLSLEKQAEQAFLERRFQDSVLIYSSAASKAPDRSSLYLGRAMALEMLKRPKKAVEDYERALALDPDNYMAMEGLAGILEREGREIERAIALYRQALERDPRDEWKENLAVWIKMLESRLRPTESSLVALWKRGNEHALRGKVSEAIESYTKAIALNPLFYQAYFRRGLLRMEQGDLNAALKDMDATVGLSPELRGALIQRGGIHELMGNEERALEDFRRASEFDSRDPFTHYHYGRLSEKQGLYVEAWESYQQAIKLKPKPELRGRLQQRMDRLRGPVKSAMQQKLEIRKMLKELW
ncbi:MAG: tetratricopeptide repeat protein [Desulfomonilaceae bacterium]|nr:tetratricopeptide repeat protein [Desulfomonilaceae bacterium]